MLTSPLIAVAHRLATIIDSDHKAQAVAQRKYQKLRHADAAEPPRSLLKERKVEKLPLEINGLY